MEIKEQVKLRFVGVEFPIVNFNAKSVSELDPDAELSVDIVPYYFVPDDDGSRFSIIMKVDINKEGIFSLNIVGVGGFILAGEDLDDNIRKQFINANATAIMFPYVRAFISTFTSLLGKSTPPIILPTRFFKGELERYGEDVDKLSSSET